MSGEYTLAEDQKFPKSDTHWNVYITASKVYFVPIDKQTSELKKLKLTYSVLMRVGYLGGAIGGALMALGSV